CRRCATDAANNLELTGGQWRYDPRSHVRRWVRDDPSAVVHDAFDEVPEEESRPPGRPVLPIKHGTYAGSRVHYRNGEKPCEDCKRAEAEYRNKRALIRHANGDPKFTCECGAFKQRASKSCARCAVTIRYSKTERRAA